MSHAEDFPLLFERSREGRVGYRFPPSEESASGAKEAATGRAVGKAPDAASAASVAADELLPESLRRRQPIGLPSVSEIDVVRHFTNLSRRSYGVDLGFYPLGSCTMKYNPKVDEEVARLPGFTAVHPLQPEEGLQGILALLHDLTFRLCAITAMDWGTLQPFAGAHGEFTGMKLFRACFAKRGESRRTKILVPDSAHGTNPASAHLAGFEVVELRSSGDGVVSLEEIAPHLDERLAGIMLTNPNTLGLFERDILEISRRVHAAGGLLYYDGANLNAVMGRARPGDMGFDVVHLNLHKTFGTPHGGGGPGSGPVLVKEELRPFLPAPDIVARDGRFALDHDRPDSIGRVAGFFGNVGILIRAYAYLLALGGDGLAAASDRAVLNANYLKERLKVLFDLPYDSLCKHELVLSARLLKERYGVTALDVAKRLLDYGIHPPTIYFPLVVPEALMIEPTESESKEGLDAFVEIMAEIVRDAQENPSLLRKAPTRTPVRRVDEVRAARHPIVRWRPNPSET